MSQTGTVRHPSPTRIFLRDWRRIFIRATREFFKDEIPTVAAGVTFYLLLAFFPGVAALVSLYGFFGDIGSARAELIYFAGILPADVLRFVGDEMIRATTTHPSQLSAAFVFSLLVSTWSANAGVQALLSAMTVAYEHKETRGLIRLTLLSLTITVAAFLAAIVVVAAGVVIPAAETRFGVSLSLAPIFRWPLLFAGNVAVLIVFYRYGPNRKAKDRCAVWPGSLLVGAVWLGVSLLFSWYVANYAHYDRTYGSLGTIVGFMMWLWLGVMVVLFGAELNAEVERAY
ncbi:MAG TPA: YihY/virulence factor BrkB family protein [Micropepsaceae bacterium]|nr:YihY/virulence factor BrkB family protein [Micropepsaceae bacterium]